MRGFKKPGTEDCKRLIIIQLSEMHMGVHFTIPSASVCLKRLHEWWKRRYKGEICNISCAGMYYQCEVCEVHTAYKPAVKSSLAPCPCKTSLLLFQKISIWILFISCLQMILGHLLLLLSTKMTLLPKWLLSLVWSSKPGLLRMAFWEISSLDTTSTGSRALGTSR